MSPKAAVKVRPAAAVKVRTAGAVKVRTADAVKVRTAATVKVRMAAVAKEKKDDESKPKRAYRRRVCDNPAPAPVRRLLEEQHSALLSREGSWRSCPQCSYPRYVPSAAQFSFCCAMPRVHLPGGGRSKCDFKTTAAAWRRRSRSSAEHEAVYKAKIAELVISLETRTATGILEDTEFYSTLRQEMAEHVASVLQPPVQPEEPH